MPGWLRNKTATIVDLFAGTGGMGIASILSPELRGRAQVVFVGERDPAYVSLIRQNHRYFGAHIGNHEQLPRVIDPVDVTTQSTLDSIDRLSRRYGGITLLLAGPPCQGFSRANSMSRELSNPLNLLALDTVIAIRVASPQIAIIENVPGIRHMKSPRCPALSVTDHIEYELRSIGYDVQTVLLDAADYGVPQHRIRSFTIAISTHLARELEMQELVPKPSYGPGRRYPYRTVRDAFSDLPQLENGSTNTVSAYASVPASSFQQEVRMYSSKLYDHVASKHSAYVLDRYRAIPAGENWRSIRDKLNNYSNPDNTHMNIYQRLSPDEPSRTIGHVRKAMTVHPWEDRGLSLREAARLQSLPDWLRFFSDDSNICRGQVRGLSARQQQVANAVCFQLTSQIISHLFLNA